MIQLRQSKGLSLESGIMLGMAGLTGLTNGIIQFHFELIAADLARQAREKTDPYGIFARASSGKYPQPGQSLKGLSHHWLCDNPPFADMIY